MLSPAAEVSAEGMGAIQLHKIACNCSIGGIKE
jgi:hypothetical protein